MHRYCQACGTELTDEEEDYCAGCAEPEEPQRLLNLYECVCGAVWEDVWDCGCDDECPECGTVMPPYDSIPLGV